MSRLLATSLAVATLLAGAACSKSDKDSGSQSQTGAASENTLAAGLAHADDLSTVSGALKEAGLTQVFDGAAPYTILAPQNAAFDKLGAAGAELKKPEQRAAMVAILRDHIVPGYLTPRDISDAIQRAAGNGAKMKTMGGHVVTFTNSGATIIVTQEDGSSAKLIGEPVLAGNGVALPIDSILKKI
ncbi:MAG: fasciclin domain-containing protein [Croceibacterium sp.]